MNKARFILFLILLVNFEIFPDNISFSGDSMQADLASGRERTILTGNAYLKTEDTVIYADKIELYGNDFIFALCTGNVHVINSKKNIEITSDWLFYNRDDELFRIQGNAVMEDKENEIVIKGGLIENRDKEDITIIQVGVRILKEDMICRAQMARYFRDEQKLELYGMPFVIKNDDEYKATRIFIDLDNDEIQLEGDVTAQVEYEDNKENSDSDAEVNSDNTKKLEGE